MTAQDRWKANTEGQRMLDKFLAEHGDEMMAAARERALPFASKSAGMDAVYENSRTLERWQGLEDAMSAIRSLGFAALNPTGGEDAAC